MNSYEYAYKNFYGNIGTVKPAAMLTAHLPRTEHMKTHFYDKFQKPTGYTIEMGPLLLKSCICANLCITCIYGIQFNGSTVHHLCTVLQNVESWIE